MKYFAYNQDGTFNGLWDSDFHNEDEIPSNKIQITKELQEHILSLNIIVKVKDISKLNLNETYDVLDYDNIFEKQVIDTLPIIPSEQEKLNAQLLKQNAELRAALGKQQAFNSQILLEMAKLKGGNV
ncbi:hypothetical protein [Clostridium cadaveris]|uniref:hypothetical protein n=1 Tax=Clostridium cadaveris TaxID=1529 RepID=UPI003991D5FE